MKRLMMFTILAILLFGTLMPAAAQEGWFVYLYNPLDKTLLRIGQDGSQETFSLGLDEMTWISSWDMSFAHTRPHVAFCTVTYAEGSSTGTTRLIVRDIAGQANVLEQDLGQSIGCRAGDYSDDDTTLAVGLVRRYEGDPASDPNVPLWELLVIDPNTGSTVATMDANNPAVAAAGMMPGMSILPEVRSISSDQVVFAEIPWGVGGFGPVSAYLWNTTGGTVELIPRWGEIAYDRLGNEVIWVAFLPDYPAGNPGGPMASLNTVMYSNESGEERIIYYSGDWIVLDARFIENGQRVAVQLLSSFDEANPEAVQQVKWIAIDRQGNETELDNDVLYAVLHGAQDGYLYLEMVYPNGDQSQQLFTLDLIQGGSSTRLWEFSATDFGSTWELAFVPPLTPAEGLQPFAAVDMSGVPIQANEG